MSETQSRILTLLARLLNGEHLNKRDLLNSELATSEKMAQRDFASIRALYEENQLDNSLEMDAEGRYYLKRRNSFNEKDILVLMMMLNLVRPFNEEEYRELADRLMTTQSKENQKKINPIIQAERVFYRSITHGKPLIQMIWDIRGAIEQQKILNFHYYRIVDGKTVFRDVQPLELYVHGHHFYLVSEFKGNRSKARAYKDYGKQSYRLDSILDYEVTDEYFYIEHKEKFESDKFRRHNPNMFTGTPEKITVEVVEYNWEYLADNYPDYEIISQREDESGRRFRTIQFRAAITQGLIMWLMSQGTRLKILKPEKAIEAFLKELNKTKDFYN